MVIAIFRITLVSPTKIVSSNVTLNIINSCLE